MAVARKWGITLVITAMPVVLPSERQSSRLEAAGFVAKQGKQGRVLTGKGVSLVDKQATEIMKGLAMSRPELARYL